MQPQEARLSRPSPHRNRASEQHVIPTGFSPSSRARGISSSGRQAAKAQKHERKPAHSCPRWDAKLGDSIVSSFFFREARRLNARVTVLTVVELAQAHTQDFGVDQVVITNANPGVLELRRLAQQLTGRCRGASGRKDPACGDPVLRLLRPTRVYSLDDRLRCVNRKFGETTAGLDMAERYRRVLMDLGASMVDRKYIVPFLTRCRTPPSPRKSYSTPTPAAQTNAWPSTDP